MSNEEASRMAAVRSSSLSEGGTAAVPTESKMPIVGRNNRPAGSPSAGDAFEDMPPAMALQTLISILLAAALGAGVAVFVLPAWLPALSQSILGTEPKAYWYLSRSSAFIAYILLWLSMVFGLLMTNKLARVWPGAPTAFDLHQHTSLLGLAFALFHALILLGDRYIQATLLQALLPFQYSGYEPLWVGLGQVAFYGLAIVGLSFYIKDRIGRRAWRLIHFLSFAVFALALVHGLWSGSDSASDLARAIYWASGGSVLFLTVYRVLAAKVKVER